MPGAIGISMQTLYNIKKEPSVDFM